MLGCSLVVAFLMFGICIRESEQLSFVCYSKNDPHEWDEMAIPIVDRRSESNATLRREMTVSSRTNRAHIAAGYSANSVFFWGLGR